MTRRTTLTKIRKGGGQQQQLLKQKDSQQQQQFKFATPKTKMEVI